MGAKLQFVLDSVSLPFFLRWRITLMNHKRQWKHRSPGKEAQLGWNVVPQRRAMWGLCDCSEIRSLRCRDGSWLEIILDLHWALNPIWDKETRRGRPRREEERQEPGSQKPKPAGPHRRLGECVEQALPQAAHEEPTLLTPRSQSSGSETGRTYFSSFKPPSLQHCVTAISGNSHRGLNQQELCGLTGHPSSCYNLLRSKTRHQLNLSLLTLLAF